MTQVHISRYTPGARGDQVHLDIGEIVQYQTLTGGVVDVEITSERMSHDQCPTYGYEGIFADDGLLNFADGARIVGWSGRNP